MAYLKTALVLMSLMPTLAFAGDIEAHLEPVASVIFWVTLIFLFGVIGRYLAERVDQPGVLGELLMGVLVGHLFYFLGLPLAIVLREGPATLNIMSDLLHHVPLAQTVNENIQNPFYASKVIAALSGSDGMNWIKIAYVVDIFSRYGIIFLLFMVGLDTSIEELKHTGRESVQVAVIGIVVPIILGFFVMAVLTPESSFKSDLFVAATLSATSIGITARVLKELHKTATREARTILGAAMLDDILGLVILAIVSSIVVNDTIKFFGIAEIIMMAVLFFSCSILIGPWMVKKAVKLFRFLPLWEAKLFISFVFVMLLAWVATLVQLATIIGAFAAGVIIHDGFFEGEQQHTKVLTVKELIAPLEFILVPLFFMLIGMQVKVELFFDSHVLVMACALVAAAILGKLVSGCGANRRDDRVLIGIGMLSRGEVGLVFASIGQKLGVFSEDLFSAIILMVIITTLIAPPLMKLRYAKHKDGAHAA